MQLWGAYEQTLLCSRARCIAVCEAVVLHIHIPFILKQQATALQAAGKRYEVRIPTYKLRELEVYVCKSIYTERNKKNNFELPVLQQSISCTIILFLCMGKYLKRMIC